MELVLNVKLADPGPPAHISEEEGVWYATLRVADEALPVRFGRLLASHEDQGPPWSSLLAGLETGRHGMRERFEKAVADGVDHEFLERVLGACYGGLFGLRSQGPGRGEFEAWVQTLPDALSDCRPTMELTDAAHEDEPLRELGCRLIHRDWETGHLPADHDPYLYDLADTVPALGEALFEQRCLLDPDDESAWEDGQGESIAYTLRAWLGGKRYACPAINHWDYADGGSVLGFLNAILRAIGDDHRFVYADMDHESIIVGRLTNIARARAEGLIDEDRDE